MFTLLRTLATVLASATLAVHASPVITRDVVVPKITSPTADSVWPVGSTQTVTWDTSNFPPVSQITDILGQVILGFNENNSLNLDFNNPLAQNFNLTDGSVQVTVPNVTPRDDYLIVLFGDSGNTSPSFSITRISAPADPASGAGSPTSSTSTTPPTNPPTPPITGSTITGGESTSSDTSITGSATTEGGSATDSASAPTTTPTVPSTTSTSTSASSGSGTALGATASPTSSAARSMRRPGGMGAALCLGLGAALSALVLL